VLEACQGLERGVADPLAVGDGDVAQVRTGLGQELERGVGQVLVGVELEDAQVPGVGEVAEGVVGEVGRVEQAELGEAGEVAAGLGEVAVGEGGGEAVGVQRGDLGAGLGQALVA